MKFLYALLYIAALGILSHFVGQAAAASVVFGGKIPVPRGGVGKRRQGL